MRRPRFQSFPLFSSGTGVHDCPSGETRGGLRPHKTSTRGPSSPEEVRVEGLRWATVEEVHEEGWWRWAVVEPSFCQQK